MKDFDYKLYANNLEESLHELHFENSMEKARLEFVLNRIRSALDNIKNEEYAYAESNLLSAFDFVRKNNSDLVGKE